MNKIERISQENTMIIGKNIERLRKEKQLRNIDVVTKLQLKGVLISTSTLSKIEHGHSNPSVVLLIALTDVLQCDYNAFFENNLFVCSTSGIYDDGLKL